MLRSTASTNPRKLTDHAVILRCDPVDRWRNEQRTVCYRCDFTYVRARDDGCKNNACGSLRRVARHVGRVLVVDTHTSLLLGPRSRVTAYSCLQAPVAHIKYIEILS